MSPLVRNGHLLIFLDDVVDEALVRIVDILKRIRIPVIASHWYSGHDS